MDTALGYLTLLILIGAPHTRNKEEDVAPKGHNFRMEKDHELFAEHRTLADRMGTGTYDLLR